MKNFHVLTSKLFPFALRLSCFLALILGMLWLAGGGQASTHGPIYVNSYGDDKANDGICTLREAVIAANKDKRSGGKPGECVAGNGDDTIILPAGIYVLSRTDSGQEDASQTGDLDITSNVTIVGGPGVTIDGSGISDRIFHVLERNVIIMGVTIKNGGGNVDQGGGIYNGGTLALTNVTLSGNTADAEGGGIYNTGTLNLNNITIANNTAIGDGGGIVNAGGTVHFQNTIIAGNTSAGDSDCSGLLSSQGYNLVGDGTGCTITDTDLSIAPDDVFTTVLGLLGVSTGGTEVHALLRDSPAIDAGDPLGCFGSDGVLTTDQRGEPRPMDGDHDGLFQCDIGAFEVGRDNLVLIRAFPVPPDNTDLTIHGLLNGAGGSQFTLDVYSTCDPSSGDVPFHSAPVTANENGYFTTTAGNVVGSDVSVGVFVSSTADDPNTGDTLQSQCIPVSPRNDSWPFAFLLDGEFDGTTATYDQYIDKLGQSRWYKFSIEPNTRVFLTLTGLPDAPGLRLPENYDLTVYKDIQAAFDAFLTLDSSEDLVQLGAEFAGDAYSGDAYSGDAYSGDAYSAISYSGDAYSGDAYSGDAYSGDAYSGDAYSGDAYSGDAYSGDAYSGDAYSGDAYSGDAYSGDAYSAAVFGGDAYSAAFSSAQTRSLIGVSAFEGTSGEGLFVNSWNNAGEFYVRVRGRNGAFNPNVPFRLTVRREPGSCAGVDPLPPGDPIGPDGDNPTTLILIDLSRMEGRMEGTIDQTLLDQLAVAEGGKIVDVNEDARVRFANSQADDPDYVECPFAKNLVAQAIKDIVDGYRDQPESNLEYVVIVGGDDIIPFFRHPDNSGLAQESQYAPPVRNNTPSQASLKLDYVLSQDAYGSQFDISLNNSTFPIPELAIGRLVETADDINAVLDAFLSTGGTVQPQTSLVTGYDFLADAAEEIQFQLEAGTGGSAYSLITPGHLPPTDPTAWTADDLREVLLGSRHDLVFLAGHFTGNSALAADYTTRMLAGEVAAASDVDMSNAIIFSIGCHAGYNIVDQHGVPYVTRQPDWAQAFASQGATLIAGTGYQYGETVTKEYSERLYIEFSKQLRIDTDSPIPIGHALNEAKLAYLTQVPQIRGLHEKALLEATIFGLPMLSVHLPGRFTPTSDSSVISTPLGGFDTDPGRTLVLQYADLSVTSPLTPHTVPLLNVDNGETVESEYLAGTGEGVVTNPSEPFLPLEVRNVTVDGTVLRGVGFRGGIYLEENVLPLTGAPTTELIAVHTSFLPDFFYPVRMWNANYFGALVGGDTRVMFTPAQHTAGPVVGGLQLSTRRKFTEMDFRLYYSNDIRTFGGNSTPALSAAPAIVRVSAIPSGGNVTFRVTVLGNPSAGMQEVWVTYTDTGAPCPCTWQSLDLTQRATDSTQWEGTMLLNGANPQDLRYMVQAVNGVGLVSLVTNLGHYFTPGVDPVPTEPTTLTLVGPSSGPYDSTAEFSAVLTDEEGGALAGQIIDFRLGGFRSRRAVTNSDGEATVKLWLLGLPGSHEIRASFAGTAVYMASFTTEAFTIDKQGTAISLTLPPAPVLPNEDSGIVATLTDATGEPLRERTVFFVVTGSGGTHSVHDITNYLGQVPLGPVPLGPGTYDVNAYFNGTIDLDPTDPDPETIVTLTSDSYEPSASATVSLIHLNTPPMAMDDAYSVDAGDTLTVAAPGVLGNDIDVEGGALTAILVDGVNHGVLALDAEGSFAYTPIPGFSGTDSFTYKANDGIDDSNVATVTITVNPVNEPPNCLAAEPSDGIFWPPDKDFWPVNVLGVTDPDGDLVTIMIVSIYQDELVGKKEDGRGVGTDTALVRAERDGNGDGRVYHISFIANDGQGGSCTGEVLTAIVPHDQGGDLDAIDGGPLYDSTVPD